MICSLTQLLTHSINQSIITHPTLSLNHSLNIPFTRSLTCSPDITRLGVDGITTLGGAVLDKTGVTKLTDQVILIGRGM
jgi:hypothetical protein